MLVLLKPKDPCFIIYYIIHVYFWRFNSNEKFSLRWILIWVQSLMQLHQYLKVGVRMWKQKVHDVFHVSEIKTSCENVVCRDCIKPCVPKSLIPVFFEMDHTAFLIVVLQLCGSKILPLFLSFIVLSFYPSILLSFCPSVLLSFFSFPSSFLFPFLSVFHVLVKWKSFYKTRKLNSFRIPVQYWML